ncbi:hypothetical protein DPMN_150357 [Dreissena polymorpha]|uniref:Uncharacterized protein n=1 Tax=Dreissena polymorpha TaxID=45954 RepID=A0A9D4FF97_DREPO|nr:hypothetical protein DPMN_150357 [Dreissena polymorpha]
MLTDDDHLEGLLCLLVITLSFGDWQKYYSQYQVAKFLNLWHNSKKYPKSDHHENCAYLGNCALSNMTVILNVKSLKVKLINRVIVDLQWPTSHPGVTRSRFLSLLGDLKPIHVTLGTSNRSGDKNRLEVTQGDMNWLLVNPG